MPGSELDTNTKEVEGPKNTEVTTPESPEANMRLEIFSPPEPKSGSQGSNEVTGSASKSVPSEKCYPLLKASEQTELVFDNLYKKGISGADEKNSSLSSIWRPPDGRDELPGEKNECLELKEVQKPPALSKLESEAFSQVIAGRLSANPSDLNNSEIKSILARAAENGQFSELIDKINGELKKAGSDLQLDYETKRQQDKALPELSPYSSWDAYKVSARDASGQVKAETNFNADHKNHPGPWLDGPRPWPRPKPEQPPVMQPGEPEPLPRPRPRPRPEPKPVPRPPVEPRS